MHDIRLALRQLMQVGLGLAIGIPVALVGGHYMADVYLEIDLQ